MQLQFTSPEHTTIRAELEEGDVLGHHHGPGVIFVPVDGGNREYADILERGLVVEDAPPPPRPSPEELQTMRVADPEGDADAVNLRTLNERLEPLTAELEAVKQERR